MNFWLRALLTLTGGKLVVGTIYAGLALSERSELWRSILPAQLGCILAFVSAAALLLIGGRENRAARRLGALFLVLPTPFAGSALALSLDGNPSSSLLFLYYLQLDAFGPFLMWHFVEVFPQADLNERARRLLGVGKRVSLIVGGVLLAANLLMYQGRFWPQFAETGSLAPIRRATLGYYWPILWLLMLGAMGFGLWKGRRAKPEEQRRLVLFIGFFALGATPLFGLTLLSLVSSRFAASLEDPDVRSAAQWTIFAFLFSIPFTTAWSVVVHRVLSIRRLARSALVYILARITLVLGSFLPIAILLAVLYAGRSQSLGSFLSGPWLLIVLLLLAVGVISIRMRGVWLEALDRRFFREPFDAQALLFEFSERLRQTASRRELSDLLREILDRALHIESMEVLFFSGAGEQLLDSDEATRTLTVGSGLETVLLSANSTVYVSSLIDSPVAELTPDERSWIENSGFELLAPVLGSKSELLAVIGVGVKRSALPYTERDRALVGSLASSAGVVFDQRFRSPSDLEADFGLTSNWKDRPREHAFEQVQECRDCGHLHDKGTRRCDSCGGLCLDAPVPRVLAGKFRFEQRVGAGGMGVVYRAQDLELGRSVAIKLLPRSSPKNALRLRREARTMAAISHPNLALIFGAETVNGRTLLILEYLAGGTLASRLEHGPLSVAEAIELQLRLVEVVRQIHDRGVLHRDIKPSNVGYTENGTPKLLDFGLAKILIEASRDGEAKIEPERGWRGIDPCELSLTTMGDNRRVVGTPVYLSPEALRAETPDFSFDLWSLCVVFFESLTGRRPFHGRSIQDTVARITSGRCTELSDLLEDCPSPLEDFFRDALSVDRYRRPQSCVELGLRLRALTQVV